MSAIQESQPQSLLASDASFTFVRALAHELSAGKVEYVRTAGGSVRIFADSLWRKPEAGEQAAVDAEQPQQAIA